MWGPAAGVLSERDTRFISLGNEIHMKLLALTLLLLAVSSCSPAISRTPFRGAPDPALLTGGYWRLAYLASSSGRVSRARAPLTVHFTANGRVQGGAGGNVYGGFYTTTPAGAIRIREGITTLIGGPEAERAGHYSAQMMQAHSFEVTSTDLRLHLERGGFLHFRRVAKR